METFLGILRRKRPESTTPEPDLSVNEYSYPFPPGTEILRTEIETISHKGPRRGAVDFIVPLGTTITCAYDGIVTEVVDKHKKHGPKRKFANDLNYVHVFHPISGEVSEYGHLAEGSAKIHVGDRINEGDEIGITGNSGWMYEPHLHFFVYRLDPKQKEGFVGLKPRFKDEKSIK